MEHRDNITHILGFAGSFSYDTKILRLDQQIAALSLVN